MTSDEKPVYSWRQCVISSDLPPVTRHVLITLSMHMDVWGDNCYPTIDQIMYETGLGRTTVIKHINVAVELGWLRKQEHGFRGREWRNNQYYPEVPEGSRAIPWKRSEAYLEMKKARSNERIRSKILSTTSKDEKSNSKQPPIDLSTEIPTGDKAIVDKVVDNLFITDWGGSPRELGWFTSCSNVVREVNPSSSLSNSLSSSVTNDDIGPKELDAKFQYLYSIYYGHEKPSVSTCVYLVVSILRRGSTNAQHLAAIDDLIEAVVKDGDPLL